MQRRYDRPCFVGGRLGCDLLVCLDIGDSGVGSMGRVSGMRRGLLEDLRLRFVGREGLGRCRSKRIDGR
jgi:hypothetical protein